MSLTIDVYAISLDRLDQVLGSCDQLLLDAILANHSDEQTLQGELDDSVEFTTADGISDLIFGLTDENCPGCFYGYGLMAICAHIGKELPNISGIAGAFAWMDKIDAALIAKSIPLSLQDLVTAGAPVSIPMAEDWPTIGVWYPETIQAGWEAIQAHQLDREDMNVDEMITQFRGWLEMVPRDSDTCIVGFML